MSAGHALGPKRPSTYSTSAHVLSLHQLRPRRGSVGTGAAVDKHEALERHDLNEFLARQAVVGESSADIYGIPREEWLQLKGPVRPWGADNLVVSESSAPACINS